MDKGTYDWLMTIEHKLDLLLAKAYPEETEKPTIKEIK